MKSTPLKHQIYKRSLKRMNATFMMPDQKKKVSGHISSETFYSIGADERNRTVDLLITNELLYQLSYIGTEKKLYQSGLQALEAHD